MPNHNINADQATQLLLGKQLDTTDLQDPVVDSSELQTLTSSLRDPNISLQDATNLLLGVPPQTKIEKQEQELIDKGFSKADLLVNKYTQKNVALGLIEQDAKDEEQTGIVTDEELDTFGGEVANIALTGVSAGVDIIGGLVQSGFSVLNAFDSRGITQEDLDAFPELERKVESGKGIPNEFEQSLLSEDSVATTAKGDKPTKRKSKFARIQAFNERKKINDAIDIGLKSVNKFLVNDKNTKRAVTDLQKTSEKAAEQLFGEGNDGLKGVGTFIGGIVDLAVDEPAAAIELTVQSLPQMILLARKAVLGAPPLIAKEYDKAIADFEKEYKRTPTGEEKAINLALSILSVGLDTVGAKAVLPAKKLIKDLAVKLGAEVITESSEKVVKEVAKSGLKTAAVLAAKPVKSAVIEGSTEGVQNVLTQLAAKQDLSKIDAAQVLTDTTIGAVSGAQISSVTSASEGVSEVKNNVSKRVNEVLGNVSESLGDKLVEAGIGESAKLVKKAKENKDPRLGIKAITSNLDFTKLDEDQRIDKLVDLNGFVVDVETEYLKAEATLTEESSTEDRNKVEELRKESEANNKVLDDLVKANLALNNNVNITESVKTVESPTEEQTDAEIKTATKDIVKDVQTSLSTTPAQVKKVLGSTEFQKNSTEKDKKILNDYNDYNKSIDTLNKTIDEVKGKTTTSTVNADTINGSSDGKFTGVKQYVSNMQKAILSSNKGAATSAVQGLQNFLNQKIRHLNNGYISNGVKKTHSISTQKLIKSEVAVITAAVIQTRNMGIAKFGSKDIPNKNAKVNKPTNTTTINNNVKPVKVKKYNTTDPEYNSVIQELNNIQITEDTVGKNGERVTITKNAGTELTKLDNRLNIIEEIYKECG